LSGFFDEAVEALADCGQVGCLILVKMDFVEGPGYYWLNGTGDVEVDGQTWTGAAHMVAVSAVSAGTGDAADDLSFTMSGVSTELVAKVREAGSIRGRRVTIYGRFISATTGELLDDTWVIPTADILDRLSYEAVDVSMRRITAHAETIWTERDQPANEFYSSVSQKAIYPDDDGFEFIPALQNATSEWPQYTE
jgi:hypothetical protein